MSEQADLAIALDLGGTKFRVAIVDRSGQILKRTIAQTEAKKGCQHVFRRITEAVRAIMSDLDSSSIVGMGIGAPGPLDAQTGTIVAPPNLPGWDKVPLKSLWEQELGVPVWVSNDANMAAVGEHRRGVGKGVSHLVYLTVSTGIGGGVIIDNKLYIGGRGLAGEVGHMTIDPLGPKCSCGRNGCLESLASGTAIARQTVERIAAGESSSLAAVVRDDRQQVTAELVVAAARSGDKLAQDTTAGATRSLGIGVANLIHLFDPKLVVIGGGVSQAGELIFDPVRREVERRLMPAFGDTAPPIVSALLGDNAGLLGAAALVFGEVEVL